MKTRTSGSHQRYLDLGCTVSRTELGQRNPSTAGWVTEIHYYGRCANCGTEMRDVDENGYEDTSRSPQHLEVYGPKDPTICTSCAHWEYMMRRDLAGRVAHCAQCGSTVASSWGLAFFDYNETGQPDRFYDGCRGWD